MPELVLDVATLRGSISLLDGESRNDGRDIVDLDICALGTLVEAICFSDEVLVPDLGHRRGAELVAKAGSAVRHVQVLGGQRERLVLDALDWLHGYCDLDEVLELLNIEPSFARVEGSGSHTFLLLQAIGAEGKYESAVVQAIRSGSELADHGGHPNLSYAIDPESVLQKFYGLGGGRAPRLDRIIAEILDFPRRESPSCTSSWLVDPDLKSFAANLAWAFMRSRGYVVWAHERGVLYMPHPLRGRMAGYAAAVDEAVAPRRQFSRLYLDALSSVHREGQRVFAEVNETALLRFSFPAILPYVVRPCQQQREGLGGGLRGAGKPRGAEPA